MKKVVLMKPRVGFRGGLEKYTRCLIGAFLEKGCEVTLLTTDDPPPIEGCRVISLAPHSKFSLYQIVHFNSLCQKWLKTHPHDVVFGMERTTSQTHYRAGSGLHAVYLKRREMVDSLWKKWTRPLNPLHYQLLKMEKAAFEEEALKVLFTNSQMVREEILSHYQTPPQKIEVIHNGTEWAKWSSHFEESLSQKRGPYHFLFVGNGYQRKGLHFLLAGLARLKKWDFQLTVIGKDKNPTAFRQLADRLGLKKKIRFMGPQEQIIPFYQQADALVLPSIYDPFANVTVEALAMGLFVITSHFNGGKEVIQRHTGDLIEELTSPDSVAASLKKAFDKPKMESSARAIRESIKGLDFSIQLDKIVCKTLKI